MLHLTHFMARPAFSHSFIVHIDLGCWVRIYIERNRWRTRRYPNLHSAPMSSGGGACVRFLCRQLPRPCRSYITYTVICFCCSFRIAYSTVLGFMSLPTFQNTLASTSSMVVLPNGRFEGWQGGGWMGGRWLRVSGTFPK